MSNNAACQAGSYVTAFAVGALLGAGLALLYAPQSGQETRALLARRARELKDKAGEALDEAKDAILEKKAEITAAVEAGQEALRGQQTRRASAT